MPLSDTEKIGLKALLGILSDTDIATLTDTVSNRTVTPVNREDATDAILMYTRDATDLLRRRKIKREVLFRYLVQRGVVPEHAADKATLIRMIQDMWRGAGIKVEAVEDLDIKPMRHKKIYTVTDDSFSDDSDNDQPAFNVKRESGSHIKTEPCNCNQPQPRNLDQAQPGNHGTYSQSDHGGNNCQEVSHEGEDNIGQQLAEHFVPWFYNMWNSSNPKFGSQSQWGPQHFFTDSELKITVADQNAEEIHMNNTNVYTRLSQLAWQDSLTFNHDTCKGMKDAYGRVIVMVAGTIHGMRSNSGTFEHMFGLLRDPAAENNWKIKNIEIRLRGTSAPSLMSTHRSSIEYR